jgi:hypothetical protein
MPPRKYVAPEASPSFARQSRAELSRPNPRTYARFANATQGSILPAGAQGNMVSHLCRGRARGQSGPTGRNLSRSTPLAGGAARACGGTGAEAARAW